MRVVLLLALPILLLTACDQSKMTETPSDQFVGTWKLEGRSMLEGIEVEITKSKKGDFQGNITKLNENKYVLMFMSVGDKLVSGIERKSNFEFELSEKKIAAPLFSQYGQSTSVHFDVQFEGKNKILLGENGSEGSYIRIK